WFSRTGPARRDAEQCDRDGRAPPITSDGRALRLQSELRVPQVYSRVHVDRTTGRHRHHRGPGEPAVAGTQQSQSPGTECRLPKQQELTELKEIPAQPNSNQPSLDSIKGANQLLTVPRRDCPVGTFDDSPAFQRRVGSEQRTSPEGRPKPCPTQPSLR